MDAYGFFKNVCSIQDEQLLHELVNTTEYKCKKKGCFIVRAGESQNEVCLMESGVARGYFLNSKGEEITDCFIFKPGSVAMAISDLKPGIPSPLAIEMLEDGYFYCIPISAVAELQKRYIEISIFYTHLLSTSLNMHWTLKRILMQYTATQRYQWFLQEYPGLIDRVNKKYIASYIGMTPVTVSRIRRTLKEDDGTD
ncbi:MAG: Crp/Fnr family transcriptional regulator [Oliverpabstia sp.]